MPLRWNSVASFIMNRFYSGADFGGEDLPGCKMQKYVDPAAKSVTAVHADYAGSAANVWTGTFTDPVIPRNLTATFNAAWDGGTVTVTGTDQFDNAISEDFAPGAGTTVV